MKRKILAIMLMIVLLTASALPGYAQSIRVRVEGKTQTWYDAEYETQEADVTAEDILNHSVNVSSAGAIVIEDTGYGPMVTGAYGETPIYPEGYFSVLIGSGNSIQFSPVGIGSLTPETIGDELIVHYAPGSGVYIPELSVDSSDNQTTLTVSGVPSYGDTILCEDASVKITKPGDASFSEITETTDASGQITLMLDNGTYEASITKESTGGPVLIRSVQDFEVEPVSYKTVISSLKSDLYDAERTDYHVDGAYYAFGDLTYNILERRAIADTYETFAPSENFGTEYFKAFAKLTAAGINPENVNGADLVSQFAGLSFETVANQPNQAIAALMALDTHDIQLPQSSEITRDALIDYILSMQGDQGGWVYNQKGDDFDVAGTALIALSPYYSTRSDVKAAVDKFVAWASESQASDGTLSGTWGPSASTTAQVILGLTAVGVDPAGDQFTKGGKTLIDQLVSYYDRGEKRLYYLHWQTGDPVMDEAYSTPQGFAALSAYKIFSDTDQAVNLFDYSDVTYEALSETVTYSDAILSLRNDLYNQARPNYYVDGAYNLMGVLSYSEDERTGILDAYADFEPTENYGTEYMKAFAKLTSAGIDPENVDGKNLVEQFANLSFADVANQPNQAIAALIALDTHDIQLPTTSEISREALIDYIISMQGDLGGWVYNQKGDDLDTAGLALVALAPYYESHSEVKSAVDKFVNWVSSTQASDGTISGQWGASAATTAQVVMGLTAVGIDPAGDLFTKSQGKTLIDQLMSYYDADENRFYYLHWETGDPVMDEGFATPQSFTALSAYKVFKQSGQPVGLYDYSTVDYAPVRKVKFDINVDFKVGATQNASSLVAGKTLTAHATVNSDSDEQEEVLLILALYDANNTMKNFAFVAQSIGAEEHKDFYAGFKLPSSIAGYSARVFVWEGTSLDDTGMILSEDSIIQ